METSGIRLPLSREMRTRLLRVESFLEKTNQPSGDVWMVANAVAILSDYFFFQDSGNSFYSFRAGLPIPISLRAIKKDMQAKNICYIDLDELPPAIMEVLTELMPIAKEKDEVRTALLGIGYLSEMIERLETGSMIMYGQVQGENTCLDEYEPHIFEKYRPALLN